MKRVLIITYYWPPAGGPGVQRWLKFVKYLPQFDIEPIVYCPEDPNYPILDASFESEVSDELTILKQPIKEPYRLANFISKNSASSISTGVIPKRSKQSLIQKLLLYIRGNFFIPDARKGWIKPSTKFLGDYISKNKINTIITTGPPHSLHLIGFNLKQKYNVNWIADFRDPWTTIGYHKALKLTSTSQKKHLKMESQVLQGADQIVVTSKNTKIEFQSKTSKSISVITNGYDVNSVGNIPKDDKFTIAHIGSLLSERNPEILWQALSELTIENKFFAESFQLNLIGVVSQDVLDSTTKHGLSNHIEHLGYIPHKEALKAQRSSQLLLLVEINSKETKAIIPGKLFEYMVSSTPILALGPKDSDVENIVKTTNTGTYFYYDDKDALKSQILSYFDAFKTNTLEVHPIGLEKYSRKSLTKSLSELLHKVS